MKKITPLMWFYLLSAIAGAIVPMYFNMQFMKTGQTFTPMVWLQAGLISTLTKSITFDFLIGSTAVLVWMIVECRRLKMKGLWVYVLFTFMIAWAFTCPLFLFMRERALRASVIAKS
jgi:hypothetical protein